MRQEADSRDGGDAKRNSDL